MNNELHLSAPHANLLITAKFGFANDNGEACLRLMVIDTAAGKTVETLIPVAHALHAANWLQGRQAEIEAEFAAANPPAEEVAKEEFAEKVAEEIIKEVQKFDASKKKAKK
jgi:hypothetical protein